MGCTVWRKQSSGCREAKVISNKKIREGLCVRWGGRTGPLTPRPEQTKSRLEVISSHGDIQKYKVIEKSVTLVPKENNQRFWGY